MQTNILIICGFFKTNKIIIVTIAKLDEKNCTLNTSGMSNFMVICEGFQTLALDE